MGAVEKLPTKSADKADPSKPVLMYYWSLPNGQTFGNGTQRIVMAGGEFRDGEMTSGKVTEITLYPNGMVRVEVQPMQLSSKDALPPKRYVFVNGLGHGSALSESQLEEFMASGRVSRP